MERADHAVRTLGRQHELRRVLEQRLPDEGQGHIIQALYQHSSARPGGVGDDAGLVVHWAVGSLQRHHKAGAVLMMLGLLVHRDPAAGAALTCADAGLNVQKAAGGLAAALGPEVMLLGGSASIVHILQQPCGRLLQAGALLQMLCRHK